MPTFSPEQRLAIAVGVPTLALLFFLWYRRRQRDESFDDDDDDDEQEPTVATAFETKIEVQIPKYLAGTIIGRGGANIKQIQKESGAYLRFKDDEEQEEVVEFDEASKPDTEKTRTIIIKGERDKARKAEFLIKKIINEQPKIFTEEHFIPQRCCGRIIGRGGMTIRHLSKVSGARMTIERDELLPDVPRKCTIVGTADQIANAKGLLDEKIAEHEQAMTRQPANQRYRRKEFPQPVAKPKSAQVLSIPYSVQFPDTSDFVEVFVSAIDNPGHFYVQLVRTGDAQKLDQLIDTLTDEAMSGGSEDIVGSIEVGTICSAPFAHDDSRYRAKVTQINNDGTVGLYYVDYGDTGTVPKYKLRKLREEYLQFPFQAIECYLANTRPKGEKWDEQASEDFEKLTHYPNWVGLMAKIVKYCGAVPCLDLYDTTTEQDVYINQEMIKRGYAVEDTSFPSQPSQLEPDDKDKSVTKPEKKPLTKTELFTAHSAPVDEEDANKEQNLSGPIDPNEFSPIKSALVKRVSKEYIETAPTEPRTQTETISEEKVVPEPIVAAVVESQVESVLEVKPIPEVESGPEVKAVVESVPEVKSIPEVESAPEVDFMTEVKSTPEMDTGSSQPDGFGSPNASQVLKPEVREMIEIEVSQAFETQLIPSNGIYTQSRIKERSDGEEKLSKDVEQTDSGIELRHDNDGKNVHVESTLSVSVDSHREPSVMQATITPSLSKDDDDEDEDLETFTSTLQKQVQTKKTFVSSVTVTSNQTKRSTVTIVPTDGKDDVVESTTTQSSQRSYAQAVRTSKEYDEGTPEASLFSGSDVARHAGNHGNTVQTIEIQSQPDENTVFELQRAVTSQVEKDGTMTTVLIEQQTTNHVTETTNQEKALIPNSQNEALSSDKNEVLNTDRSSPVNVESDSESYLSALDELTSDTDTTSYYETAADPTSGSTTSLDYLTPGNDTDTDTVKPHSEEAGTPVNSDTDDDDDDDDEYDSDDEESETGNRTPKRKASEDNDEEANTPKAAESVKLAAKCLSETDLGYRGDSEDVTESREDLR